MKATKNCMSVCLLLGFVGVGCSSIPIPFEGFETIKPVQEKLDTMTKSLPVEAETLKGGQQYAEKEAEKQKTPDVYKVSSQPWVGSKLVPVKADDKLPELFYEKIVFNHADGDAGLSLDALAQRIASLSRVSVRISPDVYKTVGQALEGGMVNDLTDPSFEDLTEDEGAEIKLPSDKVATVKKDSLLPGKLAARSPVKKISPALLKWKGSLKGYLDNLCDRLDLSWSFQENTIVFSRYATEVFEMAMFSSDGKYTFTAENKGKSSASAGGGGSSASSGAARGQVGSVTGAMDMQISESGNLNYFKSAVDVITRMIASNPGSELYVAQGTGRIVVKSSRVLLNQVREFVKAENSSLLKQVMVQMDIYNLTANKDKQFGVGWEGLYEQFLSDYQIRWTSPLSLTDKTSGVVGVATSAAGRLKNTSFIINSLSSMGFSVQHRPISIIAMNRQWARKSRLSTQSYLAETIPAPATALGAGGGGVPGLKPGSVTVGDQIVVMPYVLESNTILLKFAVSFSDLLKVVDVGTGSGATEQKVQVPSTTIISDQFTVALRPGEMMAITGLSRDTSSSDRATLGEQFSVWLGGSEKTSSKKEHFLVFIRAVIL